MTCDTWHLTLDMCQITHKGWWISCTHFRFSNDTSNKRSRPNQWNTNLEKKSHGALKSTQIQSKCLCTTNLYLAWKCDLCRSHYMFNSIENWVNGFCINLLSMSAGKVSCRVTLHRQKILDTLRGGIVHIFLALNGNVYIYIYIYFF